MQRINLKKAIQASGVLLRMHHGGRMNYMRLLKLLYIADRESLRARGFTITRDRYVAMDRGPVLSTVLDLIHDKHNQAPHWDRFFKTDGYDIETIKNPGVGFLSRADIDILQQVANKHVAQDEWDLVEMCHEFDEYKKNRPQPKKCKDIPLESVAEAVGRKADAEEIAAEQQASAAFDEMLANL